MADPYPLTLHATRYGQGVTLDYACDKPQYREILLMLGLLRLVIADLEKALDAAPAAEFAPSSVHHG